MFFCIAKYQKGYNLNYSKNAINSNFLPKTPFAGMDNTNRLSHLKNLASIIPSAIYHDRQNILFIYILYCSRIPYFLIRSNSVNANLSVIPAI